MKKSAYAQLLTPEERAAGIRTGMSLMCKQAFDPGSFVTGIGKTIVLTSLLTGIPIGIAAHMLGNSISKDKNKERELKEKINFFRGATSSMEHGLAKRMIKTRP